MTKLLKLLRSGAILWICLTIAVSGVSGMVLCIGEDGHVTLEWSQDGECGGAEPTACDDEHDDHGHPETDADDCCGDCIDIAFPSENLSKTPGTSRRIDRVELPLLPCAVLADIAHLPLEPTTGSRNHGNFPPGLPDGLLVQRTIMLRI